MNFLNYSMITIYNGLDMVLTFSPYVQVPEEKTTVWPELRNTEIVDIKGLEEGSRPWKHDWWKKLLQLSYSQNSSLENMLSQGDRSPLNSHSAAAMCLPASLTWYFTVKGNVTSCCTRLFWLYRRIMSQISLLLFVLYSCKYWAVSTQNRKYTSKLAKLVSFYYI